MNRYPLWVYVIVGVALESIAAEGVVMKDAQRFPVSLECGEGSVTLQRLQRHLRLEFSREPSPGLHAGQSFDSSDPP